MIDIQLELEFPGGARISWRSPILWRKQICTKGNEPRGHTQTDIAYGALQRNRGT